MRWNRTDWFHWITSHSSLHTHNGRITTKSSVYIHTIAWSHNRSLSSQLLQRSSVPVPVSVRQYGSGKKRCDGLARWVILLGPSGVVVADDNQDDRDEYQRRQQPPQRQQHCGCGCGCDFYLSPLIHSFTVWWIDPNDDVTIQIHIQILVITTDCRTLQ